LTLEPGDSGHCILYKQERHVPVPTQTRWVKIMPPAGPQIYLQHCVTLTFCIRVILTKTAFTVICARLTWLKFVTRQSDTSRYLAEMDFCYLLQPLLDQLCPLASKWI